jgi:hypothetical protein
MPTASSSETEPHPGLESALTELFRHLPLRGGFDNRLRRHSTPNYRSADSFEADY